MQKFFAAITAGVLLTTIGQPARADERRFSAQDVMSYCVALAHDPSLVSSVLKSQGWSPVAPEDLGSVQDDLAVAFIGTRFVFPKRVYGTSEDAEFWKKAWKATLPYREKALQGKNVTVYEHGTSGALLLTEPDSGKLTLGLSCLLAVPSSELKRSSYFPKLQKPSSPAVSLTEVESLFSEIVRSKLLIASVSLEPESIAKALGISTDIGAAFFSDVSHPRWTLEP